MMAMGSEMGYRGSAAWMKDFRHCDVLCRCRLGFYESEKEDTVSVNQCES
jgi:hypothetical protein